MGRRRFDHLVVEISLAIGRRIPRYELWLRLHELGFDPEALTRQSVMAFCDRELEHYLADRGVRLPPRALRRLRRTLRAFDPAVPTPYDRMAHDEG